MPKFPRSRPRTSVYPSKVGMLQTCHTRSLLTGRRASVDSQNRTGAQQAQSAWWRARCLRLNFESCGQARFPLPPFNLFILSEQAQLNMEGHPPLVPQDDLFETEIINKTEEDKAKLFREAERNSCLARGEKQEQFSNISNSIFKLGSGIVDLTYEQAIERNYGLQGILLKQSPNLFGGWDQRFCVLKGQRFVYKEDHLPTSANAGILNFNLLSCQLIKHREGNTFDYFTIKINNSEKQFVFKGKTLEETAEWGRRLGETIKNSDGFGKNYGYLAHYPRFWRKDYESQEEFRRSAETGDVVLFRGTKGSSMVQRAITRDEFDHVAVVLLNSKGEVLLFEANGGFGVGVCPWNRFIQKKWYQQYDLVVHRHLNILRTEAFLKDVDQFVANNMGKKYDFSLKDYLFNRTSTGEGERDVFFCSSLVAKLYKKLQLLQQNKSCTQYLPSWFSSGGGTLRSNGRHGYAYFNDQKIIVFQNL